MRGISTHLLLSSVTLAKYPERFGVAFVSQAAPAPSNTGTSMAAMHSTARSSNGAEKLSTSNRVRKTLDPCVIKMKALIKEHEDKWTDRGGIYSLAQGVVYWKPPQSALEAVAEAATSDDALHTYCPDEGLPEFRSALVEKLRKENGLTNVEVVVTAGANQAYINCVLTLLAEDERCVVFRPYYFNHVMAIQMTRGDDSLLVGPCCEAGVPDLDWLRGQLEVEGGGKIRMVTIVNPGNPTGVSLPRLFLESAVKLCKEFGIWLVVDNTYEHFDHSDANTVKDGPKFWCSSEEHVLNIFSFSKAFALAGFRVGYIAVSKVGPRGQEAYDQMLKVQDTIVICPARISQIAALSSLDAGREWVAEKVNTLDTGRDAILSALRPLDKIMGGTGAMYVMGKLPNGLNELEVVDTLVAKHGVAVIPGTYCGFPGWIRVCYSNLPPERCIDAANRLAVGLKDICTNL